MFISTDSYESIYKQYEVAIQWMTSLEIKLSPGRLLQYNKSLDNWNTLEAGISSDKRKEGVNGPVNVADETLKSNVVVSTRSDSYPI